MGGLIDDSLEAGRQAFAGLGDASQMQAQHDVSDVDRKIGMQQNLMNLTSTVAHGIGEMQSRRGQRAQQAEQKQLVDQQLHNAQTEGKRLDDQQNGLLLPDSEKPKIPTGFRPLRNPLLSFPPPSLTPYGTFDSLVGGLSKMADGGILKPLTLQPGSASGPLPAAPPDSAGTLLGDAARTSTDGE